MCFFAFGAFTMLRWELIFTKCEAVVCANKCLEVCPCGTQIIKTIFVISIYIRKSHVCMYVLIFTFLIYVKEAQVKPCSQKNIARHFISETQFSMTVNSWQKKKKKEPKGKKKKEPKGTLYNGFLPLKN